MQLQGELQDKGHQPHHYRGPFHGVSVIVRNEGVRGIYRGLGTAYTYQILLNGCRLGFYEPMRKTITSVLFKDANVQSLGVNMFCGAGSGIIGAMAGSPFFLVKTRLQSYSPFLPVGTQHTYRNAFDGLRQIYTAEGVRGLYRGVGAAMIRTGAGSSVQLPTYFFAKRRLMKHAGMEEGPALHLTSSAVSGFVVCCFMHPPGQYLGLPKGSHQDADRSNKLTRHRHVTPLQPTRKSLQRRPGLFSKNCEDGGLLCDLQRLSASSGQDITTHHLDLELSRADEQARPQGRGSDITNRGDEALEQQ